MSEPTIRILLVEADEADVLQMSDLVHEVFNSTCELHQASAVAEAERLLAREPVDVVLMDLLLPDVQGWQALWRVHERAPEAALIVLTGHTDDSLGLEAIRRGAQDYLVKERLDATLLDRSVRYAIERKRFERELKHYQEHLQDLVDGATRDLLDANDQLHREIRERKVVEAQLREVLAELERLSDAKSCFVSNVSHELKTPLASISHAVENLLAGVVGPVPAPVRRYLLMVQEDGRRLRTTVDDILDLTRLEANRLVLNRVKLNLGRLVAQAARALRLQAAEKQQQLELRDDCPNVFVACDPPKLERVLLNVLGNAIKFTPAGGAIVVTVRTEGEGEDGLAVVECLDSGVGIPHEHLPRVTQRYYRVGEHVDGTGLGLSLSKDIVELHGGSLSVRSPPPERATGTVVAIRLPRSAPPRVLAVEDHEPLRNLLHRQLSTAGYQATECESAERALELLALPERPDLLIVDLHLPGMNGLELVARVKSLADFRYLPILVVTGRELDGETGRKLRDFGVPALAKPWRWHELIEQLDDIAIGKHYLNF